MYYPKYMIRPDDKEVFSLNDDNTYSRDDAKFKHPNHLHYKYEYKLLKKLCFIESNHDNRRV